MVKFIKRKSKKPFFKNGRKFYPRFRDAEKFVRKDQRVRFDKESKSYVIVKKRKFFKKGRPKR